MELTQNALTYFKGIGIDPKKIEQLMNPESKDLDVDKMINDFKGVSKALYKSEFEDDFKKQLEVEYGKSVIKFMRDVNKTFDLGLTNDQIQELKYDEFLTSSKDIIKERNKDFSADELNAKISEISSKFESSTAKIKSEYEEKLKEANGSLNEYIGKTEFLSRWNTKNIGVPDAQRDFYKDAFYREFTTTYDIKEGGKIFNKDGTQVMNPENNGFWETIDQAIDYKIEQLGIAKKSGGSETGTNTNTSFQNNGTTNPKPSAARQRLIEEAREQGVQI